VKSYTELSSDNKVLFEKAEDCTLLMGLALLKKQDQLYREYKALRKEILEQVDVNLELIEVIWTEQVANNASERMKGELTATNRKIVDLYTENSYYSIAYIANQVGCNIKQVTHIIDNYKHKISA
jgi:hypothetical protein